ncbi:MAG TPA: FAD-dependent oxidoreductase, partial [Rhodothermales bacterium]|nr:FAD-dependent oxidoreductase [Rhodothermales bacterium]
MNLSYDIVIAGAGLAGACAALHLSRSHRVLVLESAQPAAGASGVAVGMVNPLMSKYGRSTWQMEEALEALQETLGLAEARQLFRGGGTLRPAYDHEQATAFQQSAAAFPQHGSWRTPAELQAAYPCVRAPHGG